jgi:hypothetical protein
MENNELKHLLIAYKSTVIGLQTAHDEILSLLNVVWQSEQLCEGLHSTDFYGKCFKCGEQVFVREPK